MAIYDDEPNYNNQQYDANGNSLSPTPPANNAPIAVDPQNDQRVPLQYKQDLRQARIDADTGERDNENYVYDDTGYKYQKVRNDKQFQLNQGAIDYLTAFMGGANSAQAAKYAADNSYANNQKFLRQQKIGYLRERGYNSTDIDKFIESGNEKDLVLNKGQWLNMGNGVLANNLTGEFRKDPTYQAKDSIQTTDLGDSVRIQHANGTVETVPKGAAPQPGQATGGGIGLDDAESSEDPAFKEDEQGNVLKLSGYDKYHNPKYTAANSKDIESYNQRKNANNPDANQQLVSSDLQIAEHATPDQIDTMTGAARGRNETYRDFMTSRDPETRQVYQASQRLTSQMGNAAISAAKAAGASGINTEAEIKRFTQGVPQVDYTSPENYKNSIQKIEEYSNNFRDSLIRSKGGVAPSGSSNSSSHLSDEELLNKYK
ncbi:hypothetical protein FA821_13315 [Salmonella enterica]|nr:hypothetical protein [Salmonella enterica]